MKNTELKQVLRLNSKINSQTVQKPFLINPKLQLGATAPD